MSFLLLKPTPCDDSYAHAAEIFQSVYMEITGKYIHISETDDSVSDLFVIGADSVNDFVMNEIIDQKIDTLGIRYGTDDYSLLSYIKGERRIVIFAGGRARSTVYAIYDFFERFADCGYFWDGDIIPHRDEIALSDFHICESPRFEYRGLRYFAHRGLKRFQAEHWSFEDWKAELDWMMKKRLNFFMLRIGMDDVWQRAFPDIVKYPENYLNIEDLSGYNDRSDFWTLKYRGELREKVLSYARLLDLIYPTDCGTMTHWYSRTPREFLESVSPSFLPQSNDAYVQNDTGKVWDFREAENMHNYLHLTQTMVNEYEKRNDYFHTIGLGERDVFANKRKNHSLKLVAYRRIAESIRSEYPGSKLFVASWDFVGWWSGEEVQRLVSELDPENTIILDYTSEVNDPEQSFLNWGVVNKFPWIFGLFHAYEAESELRGPYKRTEDRLKIASNDPYCKGMILWPELSHSDPIILEYLSQNAWAPLNKSIEDIVRDFCFKRYGADGERMNLCWQKFLPFMMQGDWGGFSVRGEDDPLAEEYYNNWITHGNLWANPLVALTLKNDIRYCGHNNFKINNAKSVMPDVIEAVEILASSEESWKDVFFKRDAIDIIRTVLGRFLNFIMSSAVYDSDISTLTKKKEVYFLLHDKLRDLLSLSVDYSVYQTLLGVQSVAPTNPNFEKTLKKNIGCNYCRQYAYELMDILFKQESEVIFDWIINGKREEEIESIYEKQKQIFAVYIETPLSLLQPMQPCDPVETTQQIADCLKLLYGIL